MNITLKEYADIKRQIESELADVKEQIFELFDGKYFDREIYANFCNNQRQLHSVLRQMMDNLNGQLTAFERLEGVSKTKFDRLVDWKNTIEAKE